MENNVHLPFWTWIGGALAILFLFIGIVLAGSSEGMKRGEDFGSDPDDVRTAEGLADVSVTMQQMGALLLGGVLLMTGLAVSNPGWARAVFIVVGVAALVPLDIL